MGAARAQFAPKNEKLREKTNENNGLKNVAEMHGQLTRHSGKPRYKPQC